MEESVTQFPSDSSRASLRPLETQIGKAMGRIHARRWIRRAGYEFVRPSGLWRTFPTLDVTPYDTVELLGSISSNSPLSFAFSIIERQVAASGATTNFNSGLIRLLTIS